MATYMVFARREYADPLELIDIVESTEVPTLDDLGADEGWLELVVVPADQVIWIERDGELLGASVEVGA